MIINHYLTEFVLSCVFRKVIYREQQDSPFFLLYSRQNAEKFQELYNIYYETSYCQRLTKKSPFHYVFQKYFVSLQPVPWYKNQPANFDSGGYSETWLRTLIAEA